MKNLINLSKKNNNKGTKLTAKYLNQFTKKEESFRYLNFKNTIKQLPKDFKIKRKLWFRISIRLKIKKNKSYKN